MSAVKPLEGLHCSEVIKYIYEYVKTAPKDTQIVSMSSSDAFH